MKNLKYYLLAQFSRRLVIYSWIFLPTIGMANNELLLQQGHDFFQQGAFVQAIKSWEVAMAEEIKLSSPQHIDLLLDLAVAYQNVGNFSKSRATLEQALQLAETHGDNAHQILIQSQLADVLMAMLQPEMAKTLLDGILPKARTLGEPLVLAHVLNNLGNVLEVLDELPEALTAYTQVAELSKQQEDTLLYLQALNNQAQVHLQLDNPQASLKLLDLAWSAAQTLPNNYDKGFQFLSIGQWLLRLEPSLPHTQRKAYQTLKAAMTLAEQLNNPRLLSYAKGLLGEVYEREHRYSEALQLTRQALFLAQDFLDISYLWEWQVGRILQAQQDTAGALEAYEKAVEHVQPLRTRLLVGQRNTLNVIDYHIRPLYLGLADLLLQQATATTSQESKTVFLRQVREVLERMKLIELEEYFKDECIEDKRYDLHDLERRIDSHTAILYPILLPHRTELLIVTAKGLTQVRVAVEDQLMKQTVLEFRRNVQLSTSSRFIAQAKQLYDWLIRPLQTHLRDQAIKTLVVVPDGLLRTIPFAAFYDAADKQFLIQQVAVAITPGLSVTDLQPLPRQHLTALLNGLSKGVQNFSPLPNVPKELHSIQPLFETVTTLMDEHYSIDNFKQSLQKAPYEVVHIASHGQFDRNPNKTFILTYDGRLTMQKLQLLLGFSEVRKQPVELLTLSACQTAVGDERASLGLAGVALRSGVRSAIASLWFINDESTSQLIDAFYQNLIQQPQWSKAEALQKAQQKLIETDAFRHPAYWAPLLLIGNWL